MLFPLATVFASLALVSAVPSPRRVLWPPVVATTVNTAVTGLQLAIGTNNTAILQKDGLQTEIIYANGGIGFEVNGAVQWFNVGEGSPDSGSLPLGFSAQQTTTTWQAGAGQIILNNQYGSSNFQVCEENGVYVVRLVTPAASEPVTCSYTQLTVYSD